MDCYEQHQPIISLMYGIMMAIGLDVGFIMDSFDDSSESGVFRCAFCSIRFDYRTNFPTREDHNQNCPFHPLNSVQTGDRRRCPARLDLIKVGYDVSDDLLPPTIMFEILQSESLLKSSVGAHGDIQHRFDRMENIRQPDIHDGRPPRPPDKSKQVSAETRFIRWNKKDFLPIPVKAGCSLVSLLAQAAQAVWDRTATHKDTIIEQSSGADRLEPPRETKFKDDLTRQEIKWIVDLWKKTPSEENHFNPGRCVICDERGNLMSLCHCRMLCMKCFSRRIRCAVCGEQVLFALIIQSMCYPPDWMWNVTVAE